MNCFVYHICRQQDKFDFTKGYVGISSNPSYRWQRHKLYEKDGRLINAYRKYDDIIEYVLVEGNRKYCLDLENKLRPIARMGWNLVAGGGMPPSHKGKRMSQAQKDNISKSNSGVHGPRWKGYWIVDSEKFNTSIDVAARFGCTTKTVCNRVKNPDYPTWTFEPAERKSRK